MNKCNEITVFCGVLKAPQLHRHKGRKQGADLKAISTEAELANQ